MIREPAWAGLEPSLPEWRPAGPADVAFFADQLGLLGHLSAATFHGRLAPGMFRLEPGAGQPLLLKLVDRTRRETGEQAEHIASWLAGRGIPVASVLGGYPRTLADGRLLIAMPLLDGRRIQATISDLHNLGTSLARLHRELWEHPDRDMWRRATYRRLSDLEAVRADIAAGSAYGPDPALLSSLATDRVLDFTSAALPTRPLHGDFNPGNVLVVDGQVTILDFEDVFHSVLPPFFELALAVERFVLVRCAEEDEAIGLARAFLSGYASLPNHPRTDSKVDPVLTLRSLALRSLMTLASGSRSGITVSEHEWRKFFGLERQASIRARTIRAIFEGFDV